MKTRDLMTKQVASVRATDSTAVAARLMWDCDCGAIPVLDDEGRAIAMITDRDICMAALMRDRAPERDPRVGRDVTRPAVLRARRQRLVRRTADAHTPGPAHPDRRSRTASARPPVAGRHRPRDRPPQGAHHARGGTGGGRADARRHLRGPHPRAEPAGAAPVSDPVGHRGRRVWPLPVRRSPLSHPGECLCLSHVKGPARFPRPGRHHGFLGGEQLQQARLPGSGSPGAVVPGRERVPAARRPGAEPGRDRQGRGEVRKGYVHGGHRGARESRAGAGQHVAERSRRRQQASATRRISCRRRCRSCWSSSSVIPT